MIADEPVVSKQQVDAQQIINHLPDDFDKRRYKDFLARCSKFADIVIRSKFEDLIFHHVVARDALFEKPGYDIQVWCDFQLADKKIDNKPQWYPRTVNVSCGKDHVATVKELYPDQNVRALFGSPDQSVLGGREKHYFCGMGFCKSNDMDGYEENKTPDGKRGFSIAYRTEGKLIVELLNFEKSTRRQLEFDSKYKILNDHTETVNGLKLMKPATESGLQKIKETLFSWELMKSPLELQQDVDASVQKNIDRISSLAKNLQDNTYDELLQHEIFVDAPRSAIAAFFRWKQDKSLQVEFVQTFDDRKKNPLGFLLIFQGNGYPLLYREGNLFTIITADPNYTFSGVEMTFGENGHVNTYQSYEKGKINRSLKWDKQGALLPSSK